MRKRILPLLLAALLALTGCTALLERSYNVVEPYTNRYWDTGAEDTLRAESYQDLVNSLLMLVEERAQEGTIRYYAENNANAHQLASRAKEEVLEETVLGSYLLHDITFAFASGETYATMTCTIHYRSTAGDPDNLMALSDTQSLVDLLRLAVRENHQVLTARFINPVKRDSVESAVATLWQELCQADSGQTAPPPEEEQTPEQSEDETPAEPADNEGPSQGENTPADGTPENGETGGEESGQEPAEKPDDQPDQPADQPDEEYPPCPWQIRFYPDPNSAEIVEILLD